MEANIMIKYYTTERKERFIFMDLDYFIHNGFNLILLYSGGLYVENVTKECIVYIKHGEGWRLLKGEEREELNKKCKPSAFEISDENKNLVDRMNRDLLRRTPTPCYTNLNF